MSKPCNITCARLDLIYVSTTMLALNNDWALGYPSAEPVAFSYARPRKSRYQTVVSKVKIALLPDPESYGYAHSLLVHASDTFRLSSVQQIPEDFLRFAVAHATKECRDLLEKRTQMISRSKRVSTSDSASTADRKAFRRCHQSPTDVVHGRYHPHAF